MKPGDIVFSKYHKEHFYIVLESISGKFKVFSSYEDIILKGEYSFLPSQLEYISEGFWEFHYWD